MTVFRHSLQRESDALRGDNVHLSVSDLVLSSKPVNVL